MDRDRGIHSEAASTPQWMADVEEKSPPLPGDSLCILSWQKNPKESHQGPKESVKIKCQAVSEMVLEELPSLVIYSSVLQHIFLEGGGVNAPL